MTRQYAFYFDSSACSGCKACQVACKDKNGLETGILWRRVYEISGGDWLQVGDAWQSSVYAYNLSIACNHCEKPICMEVCPAGAIYKRADGIVLIETSQCLGCGYCSWACPYDAPQYDEEERPYDQMQLLHGQYRCRVAASLCGSLPNAGAGLRRKEGIGSALRENQQLISATGCWLDGSSPGDHTASGRRARPERASNRGQPRGSMR